MASGLVAITERAADGGPLLFAGDGESIAHVVTGMSIVLGDGPLQQNGTLYISTKRLIWLSDDNVQNGYAVNFLSLSMHAISRDPDAYPVPCIYTQIEIEDSDSEYEEADEMEEGLEAENHVEENLSKVEEMRLVPRDPEISVDQIFQVLCDCALLNPDPEGEQEGEGEWYFNVNEVLGGRPIGEDDKPNEVPDITQLHIHDPRFEDAEEELENNGH